MKKAFIIALVLLTGAFSTAQAQKASKKQQPAQLQTKADSISYAAGQLIGHQLKEQVLPQMNASFEGIGQTVDTEKFIEGVRAALSLVNPLMEQQQAEKYFQENEQAARAESDKLYREKNEQWLKDNATKPGVQTTPSGLQYKVITLGKGATPKADDKVKVRYEGHFIDGKEFDSSYKRNPDTSSFKANQVIKGWTEVLQLMPVGSKFEVYIPQELGYGTRSTGPIRAYSTLIFTIELVDIEK